MSTCHGCGGEILWAVTSKGKRMPLDAAPFANGTFVFVDGMARLPELGEEDLPRYASHFATCPEAERFRRNRARK